MASAMTKQQLFSTALLAYMAESEGGFLKEFCEVMTQEGGETVTFNRLKEGTAVDGVSTMFGAGTTDESGDMEDFKATIDYFSAKKKLTLKQMNQTKIDLKNSYVRSLGNAVDRKADNKIIASVVAKNANLNKVGAVGTAIDAQAKLIIGAVISAQASAELTPDGKQGVALVINKKDWSPLATSDYVLNSDYADKFGGNIKGAGSMFFGAKVVISPAVPSGTTYVIPSNTIGWGEWEGQNKADSEYHATDGMTYHCQAVKSGGAVCIEPSAITKITSKPIV